MTSSEPPPAEQAATDHLAAPAALPPHGHEPVMPGEVLDAIRPAPGSTIVDCTLGRGGHASLIAAQLGSGGTLVGLDADSRNLEYAKRRLDTAPCRVRLFHANFAQLDEVLNQIGVAAVHGILADLGLSTNQFLDASYGLSFGGDEDASLDMRIDPRTRTTAADLVNRLPERDLADLVYQLSDERYSRRIARKIVEARRLSPITTTRQLADLVRSAVPSSFPRGGGGARRRRSKKQGAGRASADAPRPPPGSVAIDPATRTFMALRMAVNAETENLDRLLRVAPQRLARGGRFAVISFHSVEDRAVKQAFRSAEQAGLLAILTKKPLTPSDAEVAANPRSRSAKLRVAERQ